MKIFIYKFLVIGILTIATSFLVPTTVSAVESFSWPSSGYIGWIYKSNGSSHTGVDIWSNSDGGWNNDVVGQSNPVYPAYSGNIVFVGGVAPKQGVIINHSPNLFSNYWHLINIPVSFGQYTNTGTLLGHQDNDVTVHVHVTVSSTNQENGHIDPSTYFSSQLNATLPNALPTGTYVEAGAGGCGGSDVVKSNWISSGPVNCAASNSITIYPESTVNGTNGDVILHVP